MINSRPPYVLVIDQGGHSTRALVFDSDLSIVAQSQITIATFHPQARFVEHSPQALVDSLHSVLNVITQQLGIDVACIQSAGLACQRSSIVCWDRQTGKALSPVISWQDTRGYEYLNALQPQRARIQQTTGLRLSPHYGASKMRWCLEHISEVNAASKKDDLIIGPLATWLAAQVTQNPQTKADRVNAARTSLMNLNTRQWDESLCELFQVPAEVLPALADNDDSFGEVLLNDHAIPLRYVTGDQTAALFTLGEPEPEALYLNIGSGAFLQRVLDGEVKPVEGLLNSLVESTDERQLYSLEATINGAANALDWLSEREGVDVFSQLDAWLQEQTDALFINAVGGLAAPWWRDDIESRFVNNSDGRSRAIAVIESIVFLIAVNIERMNAALEPPEKIIVSGGLSRLDGLCSRLAALTGIQVCRMQVLEATALGVARRLLSDVPYEVEFDEFECEEDSALQARYSVWQREIANLKGY